ncbi:MAG: hypothetical protein HW389_1916 [Bacteroidetes bacterium]|nr:hypothetical protein [Bacteroidota bacterium]
MGLGQTMITLGMFILLIMSVISANRMINENLQAQLETQAMATSATVANDLLLEILSKKYDASSDTLGSLATSVFTEASSLGPNATEVANCPQPDSSYTGAFRSIAAYSDVDDYHGYERIVTANGITGFKLEVVVYYVASGTPDTKTTSRTNFKRIQVTVKHDQFLTTALKNVPVYTAVASY